MKNDLLVWDGKKYSGFFIIQNHDMHAGFGALILYALNGIRLAIQTDSIPIIDFNKKNCPYFYDAQRGPSVWEYYFEKVSPYSVSDVILMQQKGHILPEQVRYSTAAEAAEAHHHDPDRLATFWAWKVPKDKKNWLKNKRALGRKYVQKYIRVQKEILNKVDHYTKQYYTTQSIIGIHVRGTDFAYASPTPLEKYIEAIDLLLRQQQTANHQIFIATDQQQYLDALCQHYGERVLSYDAIRSTNHIAPFRLDNTSGFTKGEDVLIDILLLSKCSHIFKSAAATGELALWFTSHDNITDFAVSSEFYSKKYANLESTFSQLNIGTKTKALYKAHRLREFITRFLMTTYLGKALFKKFKPARKILNH